MVLIECLGDERLGAMMMMMTTTEARELLERPGAPATLDELREQIEARMTILASEGTPLIECLGLVLAGQWHKRDQAGLAGRPSSAAEDFRTEALEAISCWAQEIGEDPVATAAGNLCLVLIREGEKK